MSDKTWTGRLCINLGAALVVVAGLAVPGAVYAQSFEIISHRFPALEFFTSKMATANPDLPGNATLMPFDAQAERAVIALAAGSDALDVVYVNEPLLLRYADAGWLEPLDEYWEKYKEEFNLDDFPESAINAMRHNGVLYGIPMNINVMFFFYRTDLFEEAGLEPPTTFEEYIEAARHFDSAQRSGTVLTLKPVDGAANEIHWYLNAIGDGWFDENMRPIFNNENGVRAIETLKEVAEFAPRGFTAHANDESAIALQQDFAAMGLQWLSRAGSMDNPEQSRVTGLIDWVPPPGGNSRMSISGYAISRFSSNDKEELFKIMVQAASSENMYEAAPISLPLRRSVLEDPVLAQENRFFPAALDSIEVAQSLPRFPEFMETAEITTRYVLQAVTGEREVKEALDLAAAEVEQLLASRGYYN
jgi:multiple sugar transport system substrate-binding protein